MINTVPINTEDFLLNVVKVNSCEGLSNGSGLEGEIERTIVNYIYVIRLRTREFKR